MPATRDRMAESFVASGGSQCGFCTPGIIMRVCGDRVRDLDRALAADLCRCTGWLPVYDAIRGDGAGMPVRDLDRAARRAELEGGVPQRVGADVPLGGAPFADDTAPRDALVAVPRPPGSAADGVDGSRNAMGRRCVAGRARAADGQGPGPPNDGRRRRAAPRSVARVSGREVSGSRHPGSSPPISSPTHRGASREGSPHRPWPMVARSAASRIRSRRSRRGELADRFGRPVRVVYSREDVVRLGPKRPPIAASAVWRDGVVHVDGVVARGGLAALRATGRRTTCPGS